MNQEDRIQELEAKVAQLTALLETQTTAPRPVPAVVETTSTEVDEPKRSSRRGMLKLAGAAAVGAAAAAASNALPAAAADGSNLVLGTGNNAASNTSLVGTVYVLAASSSTNNGFTNFKGTLIGHDTSNDAQLRAGVLGVSGPSLFTPLNQTAHGVMGRMFAAAGSGSGVYGLSDATTAGISAGVRARSVAGPAVQLEATLAGVPTSGSWTAGAIVPDTDGNVWLCVASGTPGTWRKIGGAATAGAFHAVTPGRVYDSRLAAPSPGILTNGANRTVSVADLRDTTTGAVVVPGGANFVPAGATAVSANVTITETVGSGFLGINPGGNTNIGASAINWSASGQNVANGLTLTLNANRQVSVIAGGGGSTHFIIDILGYYL